MADGPCLVTSRVCPDCASPRWPRQPDLALVCDPLAMGDHDAELDEIVAMLASAGLLIETTEDGQPALHGGVMERPRLCRRGP